jgi:hypothetical protein
MWTDPGGRSLLLSPRGVPWTRANATDTLALLLVNEGLDKYTLHGLRATVATRLAEHGIGELVLIAQGGWPESRTVQGYISAADRSRIQASAAPVVEAEIGPPVRLAEIGGNPNRVAGATGRAAAEAGIEGRARYRRKQRSLESGARQVWTKVGSWTSRGNSFR